MDPRETYKTRIEQWMGVAAQSERTFIRLGNVRLGALVTGMAMAWFVLVKQMASAWWLTAPVILFVVLARLLSEAEQRSEQARRATAHFEQGLARMEGRWAGHGSPGENFREPHHVYADDLDVFGRGSLYELLCTARTTTGEQTLGRWLVNAGGREEVLARQDAVRELGPRVDLREELALLGEDVRAGVRSEALAAWGAEPHVAFPVWSRMAAMALACANVLAVTGYFSGWWAAAPVLLALALALLFAYVVRVPTQEALARAHASARDLRILSLLLERLEREAFNAPRLTELRALLQAEGAPVSRRIARLGRLVEWVDSCNHILVATLAPFLVLKPQLAQAAERWRAENGPRIRSWMDVIGEMEALNSLAAFAFEHEEAMFPSLAPGGDAAVFEASELRHPLMSTQKCVANDVHLGREVRLLIVSGSNMSGKSTLLRAMGLNCVLAWAGAPAMARSLTVSPLALGASLRSVDSLQEGRSRFYAEILRLRQIMDLTAGERPVLFLLDELLSGTNSHDRRIGAEAVVRGLLERGAIGLMTTHDLALVQIADGLGVIARNCHFEDHLEEGRISFDYKLRPGVVERSNALELMRAVGLKM